MTNQPANRLGHPSTSLRIGSIMRVKNDDDATATVGIASWPHCSFLGWGPALLSCLWHIGSLASFSQSTIFLPHLKRSCPHVWTRSYPSV
jgi:hypothetical protein